MEAARLIAHLGVCHPATVVGAENDIPVELPRSSRRACDSPSRFTYECMSLFPVAITNNGTRNGALARTPGSCEKALRLESVPHRLRQSAREAFMLVFFEDKAGMFDDTGG